MFTRHHPKITIHVVFLVIFLLSAGLAAFLAHQNFTQKRDAYYTRLQGELNTAYNVLISSTQETARIAFDSYINQPEILELYKQANSADEDVRNAVRRQLLEKLGPLYERLKLWNVRQLHFHLPNSESFLRFHRPGKYGDSLKGVRYSVHKANAEQVAVSGFEEGRIENGFRNVFPLIHNGEHLGSVEISMDFDFIRQRMEQQFHNRYAFMVRRQLVEDIVFADEQKNYQTSDISDDYLYEQDYVPGDTLQAINAVLKPKIQERLGAGEGFVIEAGGYDAARLGGFFPVKNTQGQQVAYIVSYNDDATISGYYSEFVVALAASVAGILVIMALLYFLTNVLRRLWAEKVTLQRERDMFVSGSVLVFKWQNRENWPLEYVSANVKEMLGYAAADFLQGKVLYAGIVHPEDRKRVAGEVETHGRNHVERFEHQPYRLIHQNGNIVWVLGYTSIIRDKAGAITHYLGYLVDITGHKQAEETLKKEKIFSEKIVETAQAIIVGLDKDHIIRIFNRGAEQITGYKKEEVIGKDWFKVFFPKEILDEMNNVWKDAWGIKSHSHINPILSKTGEEKIVSWQSTGMYDGDDASKHLLLSIGEDITGRKQAEEQLYNEREKLFVTLQSIGDGVITADTEGRVAFINSVAEQLTGWKQEEASGQPLSDVFHIINEKTGDPVENPVKKVLDSGKIIGLANHTALIARDGARRSIADSGAPIFDLQGKIIGVVLVFRDVTQQRKREEEQFKIKKLESVGILAGGIAHDFNNILTAILGNISLADIYVGKDHKAHHLLQEAEKASVRAKDLTQQFLTFSKGGDPVRETAFITQVITDSADFVLHGSNVRCCYSFPEDLWLVDIDTGQMSQVIQNIVINARHAMPEGGEINISGENIVDIAKETGLSLPGKKYIKISIADTGGGIPEKYIDKIFDPYFSTKQEGSGLGLAITHSIINKHDGHIFVRSKLGEGATFTVYLPASAKQKSRDVKEETQKPEKTMRGTILVMDDEEIIQSLAKQMLSHFGHEVLQAKDGKEAIAIFKEHHHSDNPIDVIIMDLTISGGMGGKDAIKEILRIDPDAKAIVSSGYSNDPVMANHRQHGFKAALAKPFEMAQLKETINSVLGQKHAC